MWVKRLSSLASGAVGSKAHLDFAIFISFAFVFDV